MKSNPVTDWARTQRALTSEAQLHANTFAALSNDLGFRLIPSCLVSHRNDLVSPLSISLALAMLANGARGETQSMLLQAIKAERIETLNEQATALMTALLAPRSTPIAVSNAVWIVANKYLPNPEFKRTLEQAFGAQFGTVDIGKTGAKQINEWVARSTSGMIDHLIDAVGMLDQAILANAAAFECDWQTPFDPISSGRDVFTTSQNKRIMVDFMKGRETRVLLSHSPDARCVALPYDVPGYSMVIVLPEHGTPNDFLSKQTKETWGDLMSGFASTKCDLLIPKMKFRRSYDLRRPLSDIGLARLFEDGADFSGIAEEITGSFLSQAKHESYVEVDEKGTKAAAATLLGVRKKAISMKPRIFEADRPFAFAIVHASGAILFAGVCNDPTLN